MIRTKVTQSKKAMALPALAQLILGVIGFILLLGISILLYQAFGPTPDQNIATLEIIQGEINTGISLMERTGNTEYTVVFPLSLESGYKIYAKSNEANTQVKMQLYDPDNHEIKNSILSSLRELKFILQTELRADSNSFFTQKQTLSNYRLTMKKEGSGKYGATIEYCSDGWCLSTVRVFTNTATFSDDVIYKKVSAHTWEWSFKDTKLWTKTSEARDKNGNALSGEDQIIVAFLEELNAYFTSNYRTSDLEGATPLYFENRDSQGVYWTPDKLNWMPVSTLVVSGGVWSGQKPVSDNQNIINFISQLQSSPDNTRIEYDDGFLSTALYFVKHGTKVQWSPDGDTWMSVNTSIVNGGSYDGEQPVGNNIRLLNLLRGLYSTDTQETFVYHASTVGSFTDPLYIRSEKGEAWEWSMDQENWMSTKTKIVVGGTWAGKTPSEANTFIISILEDS